MCRKGDLGRFNPHKGSSVIVSGVTVDEKGVIQKGGIKHNPVVN